MNIVFAVMLGLAVLCFLLTAFGRGSRGVNLMAFGLFLWVLVDLIKLLIHF